ncbi:YqcC family protein [Saccharophagus degradans]|uniref:YqcC family protein n=1 Tax=Saccharophagus degradans TaxID=86304 RepID=A0AAW7XDQ4_9GAMM|nr:YqcC family protein [Saccharophagus degradans]MDO6424557.1 YqcC family protein [Saccharophagus degradans]MDO6608820.1 YqcC family protein [Saccharophagus degradans]
MDLRANQLLSLLMDLEMHLRSASLWQTHSPSQAALASTQPFCVDTLEFQQWLQFVFIPRLRVLAETGQPLPLQCNVAPMVNDGDVFTGVNARAEIVQTLEQIDALISN